MQTNSLSHDDLPNLIAAGYRRVSSRHGRVARIDRPDWQKVIMRMLRLDEADFESIRTSHQPGFYEDHYRRVFSRDTLELGRELGSRIPPSSWDATGFLEQSAPDALASDQAI